MKPFRVTNEQAKAVIICRGGGWECPGDCPNYGLDTCPADNTTADKIAADLIDARELIDKQESLINEFRKIGQEVINWNVSYIPLIELLEKTKEYT